MSLNANNEEMRAFIHHIVALHFLQLDEMQQKFRALQENLEKAQDIVDAASLKDVEVRNSNFDWTRMWLGPDASWDYVQRTLSHDARVKLTTAPLHLNFRLVSMRQNQFALC